MWELRWARARVFILWVRVRVSHLMSNYLKKKILILLGYIKSVLTLVICDWGERAKKVCKDHENSEANLGFGKAGAGSDTLHLPASGAPVVLVVVVSQFVHIATTKACPRSRKDFYRFILTKPGNYLNGYYVKIWLETWSRAMACSDVGIFLFKVDKLTFLDPINGMT